MRKNIRLVALLLFFGYSCSAPLLAMACEIVKERFLLESAGDGNGAPVPLSVGAVDPGQVPCKIPKNSIDSMDIRFSVSPADYKNIMRIAQTCNTEAQGKALQHKVLNLTLLRVFTNESLSKECVLTDAQTGKITNIVFKH